MIKKPRPFFFRLNTSFHHKLKIALQISFKATSCIEMFVLATHFKATLIMKTV